MLPLHIPSAHALFIVLSCYLFAPVTARMGQEPAALATRNMTNFSPYQGAEDLEKRGDTKYVFMHHVRAIFSVHLFRRLTPLFPLDCRK